MRGSTYRQLMESGDAFAIEEYRRKERLRRRALRARRRAEGARKSGKPLPASPPSASCSCGGLCYDCVSRRAGWDRMGDAEFHRTGRVQSGHSRGG